MRPSPTAETEAGAPSAGSLVSSPRAERAVESPARINLGWLIKLRWSALAGQALLVVVVERLMGGALPHALVAGLVGVIFATNLALYAWHRRGADAGEWLIVAVMAVDTVVLTSLLHVTGGAANPFSFLYLVHVALGAVVLRAAWAWSLLALTVACYGALFLFGGDDHGGHAGHAMHGGGSMAAHLQGMWVAYAATGVLIVHFVGRVKRALSQREAELLEARGLQARYEKVAALGTLAAGAAHELGSPLGTIAIVAKDLERALGGEAAMEAMASDARLVRAEVERCRAILQQLDQAAGESPGEGSRRLGLRALVDTALSGLHDRERVDVELAPGAEDQVLAVPPAAFPQILRGILKNGLDASPPEGRVAMRVATSEDGVTFEVLDRGAGMSEEILARVTEPFFTTKEPGRGMGLGLFLARRLVEKLGGEIAFRSTPGAGTRVTVRMPRDVGGVG